jgi:hypothetical protein
LSSKSRLIALVNGPLAAAAGVLLWHSLDWPLIGDATIFHFIADQMRTGAVPYRDIYDVNMPLIYFVHLAIVTLGGMSDIAWRAFDLAAAAAMFGLVLTLVWPAGRAVAVHAALVALVLHLLLGPYSAGQRDYLMAIVALAATLASARAAESPENNRINLLLAGALAAIAASIKPTGVLLLALPAIGLARLRWHDAIWTMLGAAVVALLVAGLLAETGALAGFIAIARRMMPLYASLGSRPLYDVVRDTAVWLAPTAGLACAAALNKTEAKPPRLRVIIGLALFGLVHLFAQRKGWFYHVYPLGFGLICWGAWSLGSLSIVRSVLCVTVTAAALVWLVPEAFTPKSYTIVLWPVHSAASSRIENNPALRAAAAMQRALERQLPRGARVQVLDSDNGAFLAMARAGMRQATPHIQWFSLLLAPDSVRQEFIAALEADPPAAILLTNAQWPRESGFDAADRWPTFAGLIASRYSLEQTGDENGIAWRLYVRRVQHGPRIDAAASVRDRSRSSTPF